MKETQSLIITIGRQFGSGGRGVAKILSEKYGIPLYDKELINRVSRETGICNEVFSTCDECTNNYPNSSLLGGWSLSTLFSTTNRDMLSGDSLFAMQSETIRRIASEGPCVIVGRIADYVLRNHQSLVSVFITADMDDRVKRIMEYENIDAQQAANLIKKVDKMRSSYYNFYSEKTWGSADSYQLCINTSKVGIEAAAQLVMQYVEKICANSAK
jgi:cytidylate kinase